MPKGIAKESAANSGKSFVAVTMSLSRSRSGAKRVVDVTSGVNNQPMCANRKPLARAAEPFP